jgi:hypothetical protein
MSQIGDAEVDRRGKGSRKDWIITHGDGDSINHINQITSYASLYVNRFWDLCDSCSAAASRQSYMINGSLRFLDDDGRIVQKVAYHELCGCLKCPLSPD